MPEMKSLTLNDKTYDCFVDSVARSQLETYALIDSASGEQIALSDASNYKMTELRIFGKTIQDGTPTPENPVELVSLGNNGSITVNVTGENDSQSMAIATPNGLPGIKVTSGGNYTDSNGQQWICDEIDFGRGVYVKRINTVGFEKAVGSREARSGGENYRFSFPLASNPTYLPGSHQLIICNALVGSSEPVGGNRVNNTISAYMAGGIYVRCDAYETLADFLTWAKNIGLNAQYVLTTPIETPLSDEELAAYATLHTYRNSTTVSNDAGAYMELEYVMDAKKYIDSLVIAGGASARIANVTILASAWKTEADGLHSQVVNIAGVTKYSKVDLLPSVEQLAIFHNKDVAFLTENEDGVVTVYAIGEKPILDYTMQVSITEVVV